MISFKRATVADFQAILDIGTVSVKHAHLGSCREEDLDDYMGRNYNGQAIREQLEDLHNIYHILFFNDQPVGFTKLVLNAETPELASKQVAKLDRIYLLPAFFDKQLGKELLNFTVAYAKQHQQSGIWLVTWVGNERAIRFYTKAGFEIIGSYQFQVTPETSNLNHRMYLPF